MVGSPPRSRRRRRARTATARNPATLIICISLIGSLSIRSLGSDTRSTDTDVAGAWWGGRMRANGGSGNPTRPTGPGR
jgi:hypothetical protein